MCFYDVEQVECFVKSRPTARKDHRCTECGETILAGTVYLKITGIFDGNPFTEKQCRRCCWDRKRIREHEEAEGCKGIEAEPGWGGLLDGLHECGIDQTKSAEVPEEFAI